MTDHEPLPAWDGVAPVQILDRIRRFNRAYLNRLVRRLAGRGLGPLVLIRHRGRSSGQAYVTPVAAQHQGDGFIIPMTYGERADWVKNVLASARAEIRFRGETITVGDPTILDERAAAPLLSPPLDLAIKVAGIKRFMRVRIL